MRRLFYLSILLIFGTCFGKVQAQSLITDALCLQRAMGADSKLTTSDDGRDPNTQYDRILYKSMGTISTTPKAKSDAATSNPFLKDYLAHSPSFDDVETQAKPSPLTSIGGLNVTTVADGIAKFLVTRAKQELNIAFFDRFQKALDSQQDLKTLFPETVSVLNTIGDQIYNYEEYINALKSAFKKDLHHLLDHISDLVSESNLLNAKQKAMFSEGIFIIQQLHHGSHPGAILHSVSAHTTQLTAIDTTGNLDAAIRTTDLVSQTLRSSDTASNRYWVPMDSLLSLNDHGFRMYMGLLYEKVKQAPPINFRVGNKTVVLQVVLDSLAAEVAKIKSNVVSEVNEARTVLNKYRDFVMSLLTEANNAERSLQALKGKTIDISNAGEYANFIGRSVEFMATAAQVRDLPGLEVLREDTTLKNWFALVSNVADLMADLQNKDYGAAIFSATDLLTQILPDSFPAKTAFLKYGNFMANVVDAKTSDEVEDAIEAAALPPGSSRIKKESPFSVAINGYVGAQYLFDKDTTDLSKLGGRVGITAPVGLTLSMSLHPCKRKDYGMSLSLFLSLIDVGAIASFRLKDDSTDIVSEIHLADIFSPGANLMVGLPRVPISLGLGYQAQSMLRRLGNDGKTVDIQKQPAWGWHATMAVDIPVFNLYAKAQKVRLPKANTKPASENNKAKSGPQPVE